MGYYLIFCKGGHVSKRYYMPICFPIEAENGREAAALARKYPRVKRDHKDAILYCVKTDYDGYLAQIEINKADPYLRCKSKHQQKEIMDLISPRLVVDNHQDEISKRYLKNKVNLFVQTKRLDSKFYD